MVHMPVLVEEVIELLNPQPNENFIDATLGGGGHAKRILEKTAPNGKLLGIELDENTLKIAEENLKPFQNRIILVQDNFIDIKNIAEKNNFKPDGIIFDLGISSFSLESSGRGFSFLRDEPLDMRFKIQDSRFKNNLTAADIVNNFSEKELAEIFWKYGEEKFSRRIAKEIVEARKRKKIETTFELVEIIKKSIPKFYQRGRIHPATKIFQALRIAVNNELENLKRGLNGAIDILSSKGRVAVISFHSLEDRIVKNIFRDGKKSGKLEILTKKPVVPTDEEVEMNPRCRSAKLRMIVKI